ncbi:MAG TPA: hypothetical protein ENJ33_05810 [Thiothrix sp.]|nr:hypothetical protein [Thiothrix sp.]
MKNPTSIISLLILVSSITACSQQKVNIPEATPAIKKAPKITTTTTKPRAKKVTVIRKHQQTFIPKRQQYRQPLLRQNRPYVYNPKRQLVAPPHSKRELRSIANRIFKNEAGSVKSKLVHWNHGENFAAMGIGHWTWYPAGPRKHTFGNSFPGLLTHMERRGIALPLWLKQAKHSGAPWSSRRQLMSQKGSYKVRQLEDLLFNTRDIQAEYIIQRAKRAMPNLVRKTPSHLRSHVANNLNAVANTPGGWYALVDYVNFKGEGLHRSGGYRGQNWGLLQVLENMRPSRPGQQALNNFSNSALAVLQRRVRNSPPRRNERRWLAGWANRINTYRHPLAI